MAANPYPPLNLYRQIRFKMNLCFVLKLYHETKSD